MSQSEICSAIHSKRLISFYYSGDDTPGIRTVEPYMVAYNRNNHLALSAWFVTGASDSHEGQGWREYLVKDISAVTVLSQSFGGARPGYKPDGGKSFHNVQCGL